VNETPRTPLLVVSTKAFSTPTVTADHWVPFPWISQIAGRVSVLEPMAANRAHYLYILLGVVEFVSIDVMDLLPFPQPPTELLFRNKAVFICVPSHVGKMMLGSDAHEHVPR
jgi:hypothetical protein